MSLAHTSRHKYFHFVNCVLRYHFGQKTWPWPSKWENHRFCWKTRNLHFHGRGHVFRQKRQKTHQKSKRKFVCMYVCMYVWPCRARKYDQNGPYIHTWTNAVSKRAVFFMYVSFCPHRPRKRAHPDIHTYMGKHTYIHPYITCLLYTSDAADE